MLPLLASSDCFALREGYEGKFMQCVHHKSDGNRIEATAHTVAGNARTRFFLEPSEEHEGFVHIRNCYNNKYWLFASVEQDNGNYYSPRAHYIGAVDVPGEDRRSPSCTLFQIIPVERRDNQISIRAFSFKQQGHNSFQFSMEYGIYIVVGLSRQKELPKYVALKGKNGKYLRYVNPWVRCDADEIGDPGVICTIFTNDDGTVQIKFNNGGYWWKRSDKDDRIYAGSTHRFETNISETFKVLTGVSHRDNDSKDKASSSKDEDSNEDFIALQNLHNNKFCNIEEDWLGYLCASENSISQSARFKVEYPVFHRETFDAKFNLDEARIYNNELVALDEEHRTNHTSCVQKGSFSFKERKGVVTSWETTISSKTSSEQRYGIKIGKLPIVIGAEVRLDSEAASSQVEAGSVDNSIGTENTQNFTLHPGKTITAIYAATQAYCDVPYSYTERMKLTTGETIVTVHEDGIYTGVNMSNFHITVTES